MNLVKSFLKSRLGLAAVLVICFAGVFYGGVVLGYKNRPEVSKITSLFNTQMEAPAGADFAPFWKVWNVINEKYVSTSTDPQKKVWGAIEGLAESLGDPYTVFMPPVETKNFAAQISGNFGGVGMEIGLKDGVITIVAPLKGSPAEKAGLRPGDKVLQVDKKPTSGLSVEQTVAIIRGEKGTTVALTIFREGKKDSFEVKIVRDIITLPTTDTELRPDGIFVLKLYNFSAVADQLFRNGLQEFVSSNSNKLIIDLRGNPGGYLDAAVSMASWFLPKGAVIVSEKYGGRQAEDMIRSFGYGEGVFPKDLKVVILVNGGSASASEILAGALHDNGVAKLVGSQTFGKGSVQELVPITSDTNFKVTIAKWYTPNGISISEKGITPDFVVDLKPEDAENKKDPQLDKAVQILLNGRK